MDAELVEHAVELGSERAIALLAQLLEANMSRDGGERVGEQPPS